MQTTTDEDFITVNKKGIAYAAFALGYEIMVCFVYGFLFSYHADLQSSYNIDHLFLTATLAILTVIGFALINSYITNSGVSGMALTLLAFALTIQHYFLMRAFWDKAGANDPSAEKHFDDRYYNRISWINSGQDRGQTYELTHASVVDAIACAISITIALTSVIGRVQALEVFFLTLFGSFLYEVNNQLMWNLYISDIGYGMRIFLFGGMMGLFSSLVLGRKNTTVQHVHYKSVYSSRGFGLLGLVIVFSAFPMLVTSGVYNVSENYAYIAYIVPFNMWFALGAGILGAFSISALTYRKIFLHDLVHSGLAGGIAYSSCSVLHRNPAVPLTVGFGIGFIVSLFHSKILRRINKNGVVMSLGVLNPYILPGFFAGVMSSILYGINQGDLTNYNVRMNTDRSISGQGGFQMIGVALSAGIGLFAGAIIGLIFKICNRHSYSQQFNDNAIFSLDRGNFRKYQVD